MSPESSIARTRDSAFRSDVSRRRANVCWRVVKLGGTTVADPGAFCAAVDHVIRIAKEKRVAVVVSALAGVTDAIAALLEERAHGEADLEQQLRALARRHLDHLTSVVDVPPTAVVNRIGADIASLRGLLVARHRASFGAVRGLALSIGERLSARIVTAALATARGCWQVDLVDAAWLLVAEGSATDARPDLAATRRRTAGYLAASSADVWVVPGFFAQDRQCRLRLLGRGGSDTSATLLGAALDADHVEIWTDVDGVYDADPRLHPSAVRFAHLDFDRAEQLARSGARVLHARSIHPARSTHTPIVVRDAFRPSAFGTWIGVRPEALP